MPRGDGTGPQGKGPMSGRDGGRCRGRRGGGSRGPVSRLEGWGATIGTMFGIVAAVLNLLSSEKRKREDDVIDVTPEKEKLE